MNTTTPRQYRLLRDLPDAKAGTILTFDGDNCYDYNSNRTGQGEDLVTVCWYKKDFVENNLDWFELVTPVVENEKKYLLSVDDICSIYNVWSLERKQSFRSALNEYVKQIPTKSTPPTTSSIEEEKGKDWKIIEMRDKQGSRYSNVLPEHDFGENWIGNSKYYISMVKRLSDGIVFTVGDIVNTEGYNSYPKRPIKRFFINDNGSMYIQWDEGYGSNDGCMSLNAIQHHALPILTAYNAVTKEKGCPVIDPVINKPATGKGCIATGHDGKGNKLHCLLSEEFANDLVAAGVAKFEISKPEDKPVLFTTEDGVGLKANELYWAVFIEEGHGMLLWHPYRWSISSNKQRAEFRKDFSTEGAAKEYILLNKPCMSINELCSTFSIAPYEKEKIIKLAKSKQK